MDGYERKGRLGRRLADPNEPDSMDVRKALLARVEAGEISLEEAQREIRRLKRQR